MICGISTSAISWSTYFDALFDYQIKNYTVNSLHLHWNASEPFTNYVDLPAIGLQIIFFIIAYFGVKYTVLLSNVLAFAKIILLLFIIICSFVFGSTKNLTAVEYKNGINGIIQGIDHKPTLNTL
jgi:amino acid transporter